MNWHVFAFLLALAISFGATPVVRHYAKRFNILVHPGGRRIHARPMPLWGGLAIYVAFAITCIVIARIAGEDLNLGASCMGLLIAGAIVVTAGMLDDVKEFSAATQVAVIVVSAIVLVAFKVRIQFLSNPFSEQGMVALGTPVSLVLTLAWVFAVTKTVDFMDGLDGLAAGIGAIAAGTLAIIAYYAAQPHVALMAAALSGACVGFLRYNFNPAKIFMGTGGSQFIGFALAGISIIGAFKVATAMAIALPILVLGVPIFDGLYVMIRRLLSGKPVHVADLTHLHHRLMEMGLCHRQAVIVIYAMNLLLGAAALAIFLLSK